MRVGVNTYGILGITGFMHNPQARLDATSAQYHLDEGNITELVSAWDYNKWYNLRAAKTEKQDYGLVSLGIPMGVGASFIVNYNTRVGIEFVWNVTFTDHLDDSMARTRSCKFLVCFTRSLSRHAICVDQPQIQPWLRPQASTTLGISQRFRWDMAYESPRESRQERLMARCN